MLELELEKVHRRNILPQFGIRLILAHDVLSQSQHPPLWWGIQEEWERRWFHLSPSGSTTAPKLQNRLKNNRVLFQDNWLHPSAL